MAQYQRGMVVKARTTAKSVKIYTRRAPASPKAHTAGTVAKGTRGMIVAAKVTAVSVKKLTRKITVSYSESNQERSQAPMADHGVLDPWGNFNFALYLGVGEKAEPVGYFMEASGLKTSAEVFEIKEGGLNGRTHKRVGQSKWENIVLKVGLSPSNRLAQWRDKYLTDKFTTGIRTDAKESTGHIALLDNAGKVLRRYEFANAWPVSWEGPSLSSGGSDLAVETIEIAHSGLKISDG
ncbi:MAG: phage tail protein [Myxococcota bacterium]